MSQTNVREGYRITTLEVVKLVEDLIIAKCIQLRNAQIPKVFYKAAYSAKVKTEDLSNMLTLILSKTAQRRSSSVISNRSIALITNKFSVALLTKPAILNDANIALVDAVHYSVVINTLMMTLIKDDDDLLGTINSYIKPPLKRYKTKVADSRHAKASGRRTKKDKDLEDSDTSSDILRLPERKQLGKKAQLKKTRDEEELAKLDSLLDSDNYCLDSSLDINPKNNLEDEELIDAYILYFKELLSNNSRIFANAIGMSKTRAIVLAIEVQNAQAEGNAIEHNAVDDDDKLYPTKGERTFYYADSPLENMSRLTKEEVIKMQINTTNAIFKALAAANKLVALQSYIIPEANTPAVHSKAIKHRLALLAAWFVIVCGFRKVDKHVFRAYNTISVTAQRMIIRKGGPYIEKRVILLSGAAVAQRFILKRILKTRDLWGKLISGIKGDFLDILEKEGLNKLEASRRVIFNCFEMQAIASYSALATLKAAQFKTYSSCKVKRFTLNSVKDLFTNLSKDYFLVREARAITKSSLKFQNLLNLCSELAEMCVSIVYFNLDSELELKVLGKQDVKTTS
ncbi:hypothetical protein HBI32_246860 [Parastagonospora nodorum]|nr:hypothetical protein HBI32_246860 [Parastagonospora nodorum]